MRVAMDPSLSRADKALLTLDVVCAFCVMPGTSFISIRQPLSDVPLASLCGQFSVILKAKGDRSGRPLLTRLRGTGYFHVTVGMIWLLSTRSLYRIAN